MKKERAVFISAIFLSTVWHLFWMSMITVVITPSRLAPSKFSKVSFLGPILERRAIELGITRTEHSFIERRYLFYIDNIATGALTLDRRVNATLWYRNAHLLNEPALSTFIEEALSGPKLEPTPMQ